ncbi:hypothetical protein WYI_16499, partial [Ochrobactrum sp. CDB2]
AFLMDLPTENSAFGYVTTPSGSSGARRFQGYVPSECIHFESTLELFLKYMKCFITFKGQKSTSFHHVIAIR